MLRQRLCVSIDGAISQVHWFCWLISIKVRSVFAPRMSRSLAAWMWSPCKRLSLEIIVRSTNRLSQTECLLPRSRLGLRLYVSGSCLRIGPKGLCVSCRASEHLVSSRHFMQMYCANFFSLFCCEHFFKKAVLSQGDHVKTALKPMKTCITFPISSLS